MSAEQDLDAVTRARDAIERTFLLRPGDRMPASSADGAAGLDNIVGVGIGEKAVAGAPTGQLAVKVFVKEKLNPRKVSAAALVKSSVEGIQTDVDATGDIFASRFTARLRPVPCGVSIGNCGAGMPGTLGCLVAHGEKLFVLSNNHVIALVNGGPIGAGIPQPGLLDQGVCPGDVVARLTRWIPIAFDETSNVVDAAIARTSPELVDRRVLRPAGLRQRLVPPEIAPALNMMVQKSGRTTQYRRGLIDALSVTVDVSYAPTGGVARFTGQFRVRGIGSVFSDRGDSGSLVTNFPQNNPVGLLFAGNALSDVTFCNPIRAVLSALDAAIVY